MITLTEITIIPLISLILYVFILMIILTSNKTKLSKSFSLYIIAMIIWSLGSFLMKTDIPPSSLFWDKVLLIGFVSVPVLLLRFSYIISEYHKGKAVLYLGYILALGLIVLSIFGFVVKSAEYSNGVFTYEMDFGVYIVAVVGTTYSALALGTMVLRAKRKEISIKKVRLVIIGLALVIIGAASNLNTRLGEIGIDIIFNAINAILITYAIYRNKFLEINLIVKKGLSFSLYNIVLFGIYTTAVLITYNGLQKLGITELYLSILIMSPMFLVLEPLRKLLQRLNNHIFYRATTDRQLILRDFSNLINSAMSLDLITNSFINAIKDGIDSREVSIMLKNSTKYILSDSTLDKSNESKIYLKFNHPIVTWFNKGNSLLLSSQINNHVSFKGLWDQEKEVIKYLDTEIVVPITYLEDLIGMVIISGRNDETPYSEDETDFLKTLINNAAAIIENAKTIENIKKQSITDELTKLYNHRYFFETVSLWMSEKVHDTFSIAMIDLDQFKIYNDLYGHLAGDKALKRIAELLTANTTKDDLVVRYGGEEFVIFIPNTNGTGALKEIEKIRRSVEEEFLLSKDIKEFLTVTIGAASYPKDGSSLEEIISKADEAMYIGKQSGRNKAVLYKSGMKSNDVSTAVQEQIKNAHLSSIYALAATIDAKDHYTFGHSNNVSELSAAIAKEAKFDEKDIDIVRNAGLLHDIGKVGIPESILSKPGFLTDYEMEIMQSHVIQSISIIKHIPNLIETVPVIISHHERYDGQGYPRGIKGNNIPVLGRIICIADSFDAMTTDRPYRRGLTLEQAEYELKKNSGKQFDPELVELFLKMIKSDAIEKLSLENRTSI